MIQKIALVTGASRGGIGSALVEECQRQGFSVFATVRSLEKGSHLQHLSNVRLVTLDVTQNDSVAKAVEHVRAETGGKLDVLINNSGGGYTAPLLDSNIDDGQRLFDVNVWGPLRMTKACAGMLIFSKGCVVNIGSIAGVVPRPWMGASR